MKLMRNHSVKWKITLWLTLLMALLSCSLLAFMLTISRSVTVRTAMNQLSRTVRDNAARISYQDGRLDIGSDFQFSRDGVTTLVYSRSGALVAGQVPVGFTTDEAYTNGTMRTIPSGDTQYLLLDLWVPSGWEEGVWLRGLLEMPADRYGTGNILRVAAVALPLFILLAAAGGYLIVWRSFRPLDQINATASAISEARDLSRRIGLPPGRDEFSQLAETFDRLFERLERSFEAEKQFTADASHELRTPVSIIRGACEYGMRYDETPEERRETLEMIYRQTVKMSELINQLLSMTRLDQGTELPEMRELDLAALARDVVEELAPDYGAERLLMGNCVGGGDAAVGGAPEGGAGHVGGAPETRAKAVTVTPETGAKAAVRVWERGADETGAKADTAALVRGDEILLSRLLRNLIDNGFKYGREDGHVWVSVSAENGEVLLSVRDDGIGIPPEHREKIWQRFYQVDPSRGDETGGAGLGLAMVWQIARLHGGHMTLDSVLNEGSTFTLHLPASGRADALTGQEAEP